MGLAQALQELYEHRKHVEISWLWNGGVDVNAGGEKRNFRHVADVTPWLRQRYGLKGTERDQLASELQRIYDSEINITIRTGRERILVALGTDFWGFGGRGYVTNASQILSRLQSLIHKHAPMSKYDVEWGGRTFTE